jgi:hypothetical protein
MACLGMVLFPRSTPSGCQPYQAARAGSPLRERAYFDSRVALH